MAGHTARRSGLGSAGMVVEMYKNLTDRAGNSCFIGPLALRPAPNTAPHICGIWDQLSNLSQIFPFQFIYYFKRKTFRTAIRDSFQTLPQLLNHMTFQPAFATCGFLLNYVPYNIFRLEFMSISACWSAFSFIIYFILILNSTEGRALYRL